MWLEGWGCQGGGTPGRKLWEASHCLHLRAPTPGFSQPHWPQCPGAEMRPPPRPSLLASWSAKGKGEPGCRVGGRGVLRPCEAAAASPDCTGGPCWTREVRGPAEGARVHAAHGRQGPASSVVVPNRAVQLLVALMKQAWMVCPTSVDRHAGSGDSL